MPAPQQSIGNRRSNGKLPAAGIPVIPPQIPYLSQDARALVDAASCGLLQTDSNGLIRWANQVFCNWVGLTADALEGVRKLQDLFTIGGRIFHQTHWVPLIQMQHSLSEVKFDVVHADGFTVPMVINGIRRLEHGEIVHNLSAFVARDRDRYERELVKTSEQLTESLRVSARLEEAAGDRAILAEQLIGIVSHDLRTPLSAIGMSALVIESEALSTEQMGAVQRIKRGTERAARLIHDLLDFTNARLRRGMPVHPRDTDFHQLVRDSVDELRHAHPRSPLVLEAEGPGACVIDPDRLSQVLSNLVSNAITYGEPDAPVNISAIARDSRLHIAVHNTGNPIHESRQREIFKPMIRGPSESGHSHSAGLGLYIVSEIVKAHGGQVSLSSTEDAGTVFSIVLPCTPENDTPDGRQ